MRFYASFQLEWTVSGVMNKLGNKHQTQIDIVDESLER